MNKPLIVILFAVVLDSIGIGLIFPILPRLLREVGHTSDIALTLGLLLALYSACQFLFSPILGVLSDRFGRRPVLLVSLAGAAIDYLVMAFAPELWLLVVGRAIAGITSANMAVATAYITDISSEEQRAQRFGYFHAMFGIGFIIGPVLGGILGDIWVRAPFLAAAGLNAINLAVALFLLPESRKGQRDARFTFDTLNPFKPLRWALTFKALIPLMAIFVILNFVGTVYGTAWAQFSEDMFEWSGLTIGLSLGAFGVCHALAQAFLTGPAVEKLGERWALVVGMAFEGCAMLSLALVQHGWILFAMAPVFALGGIGMPALQSLITRQVDGDRQGQLQGVLASLVSLAAVFGPLFFSFLYFEIRGSWPGLIWVAALGCYLLALPLMLGIRRGPALVKTGAE
ncbi:MAG: Tet(A)/Tet(B)/Tet(C) family tetracycline efflux MFS transporter [Candidatus Devosia phytovorans]|uniref:Tet(A)/Tet(B)/Tet(C) family tetracycline efflux MFS transporter n=1 Tax=Candidatus Devosia phytovorans TaxID=3121372 RepID=A0AAJ6B1W7_9HYPH|nr:Tet(A)/Tet(B)/Tet(C) family tetracycline efflux MFS transporter [Devosia sp.]WEK06156.1 MAG: Tet(A)/Tet(B)/Tet(C) family tetracycline efflux MFS transporter [Devosia sp.]